jgi:ABC-2 type transport system ATP-binding protein
MIAGLLAPDSGEVLVEGQRIASDSSPVKNKLGLVPQDLALFDELSAVANLSLFGALHGVTGGAARRAMDRALHLVGLRDRARDRVREYSGGMKRRLNIAAALIHDPRVLLLDEPTVGVDPQSRNAIFENLETLRAEGRTLVYTTHYMEEVERLCDRIVIVDHGRVVADDNLPGLLARLPASDILEVRLEGAPGDAPPGSRLLDSSGGTLRYGLDSLDAIPSLLATLSARGCRLHHIATARPSIESVFLHLTGRSLRDP